MDVRVSGRVLWELFTTLHPVFKKALPKIVDGRKGDLSTQNYITKIRHNIRVIPLILPDGDLDQTMLNGPSFSKPLHSLFEVLEHLVSDDIGEHIVLQIPDCADQEEQSEV